jgi:hypothetical protein
MIRTITSAGRGSSVVRVPFLILALDKNYYIGLDFSAKIRYSRSYDRFIYPFSEAL